ncbi:MAG: PASTA domain-containing protein [Oscillospiraceae bacterium]
MDIIALLAYIFPVLILILLCLITAIIVCKVRKKGKIKPFVISAAACAALLTADLYFILSDGIIIDPPPPLIANMPDLVGHSYFESKADYSDQFDLTVENQEYSSEYPEGTIIQQNPPAGKEFLVGRTTVKCVVSKGIRYVSIPNVIGFDLETAKKLLVEECGFSVVTVYKYSDEYGKGFIIEASPNAGEKYPFGSNVILTVSMGEEIQTAE